ncbi:TPA: hypothetical protein N0F65_000059 [Lagenidium giganteum]|uniref:Retrovirus-related Pol polyprotein from transposon TNT 1-94-like beta-barrel domain-containing protein n=1 Tax=Lagenidium giganteum TaxID=4803 RepID=A0AAV2YQN7_9STRA|nr:TPA: hypothetical protein N0F65_000059 [Lagenidium giganteum]
MEDGNSMATHLDRFGELVMAMEAVGDAMDATRQLVILLGSLPQEYDMIVTVIENTTGLTLDGVKEKLLRHYEKLQQLEPAEGTFKRRHDNKRNEKGKTFRGKCFACGKIGRKEAECKQKKKKKQQEEETTSGQTKHRDAWLIDSGASSPMSPNRGDFIEYRELPRPITITIADGKMMNAVGRGRVRVICEDGKVVTMCDVLHVEGLDRRLLSVPKLTERGFTTQFDAKFCSIMRGDKVFVRARRVLSAYVLYTRLEHAMYCEMADATSKWELWHARLGHANPEAFKNTHNLQPVDCQA